MEPIQVAVVDPATPHAQHCLEAYAVELDGRFDAGFDVSTSRQVGLDDIRPPAGRFLVATCDDLPVGCVGLRLHGQDGEIKRMWVDASVRGTGLGRRLLEAVEAEARAAGAHVLRLETNRTLREAIALYRSAGYREVEPFNDEPYAHLWFEKAITD
jgi:GNAT superfamily N-acetyltransferase